MPQYGTAAVCSDAIRGYFSLENPMQMIHDVRESPSHLPPRRMTTWALVDPVVCRKSGTLLDAGAASMKLLRNYKRVFFEKTEGFCFSYFSVYAAAKRLALQATAFCRGKLVNSPLAGSTRAEVLATS